MAKEQISVRFETSEAITDNASLDNILLSGPVEIFAVADTWEELNNLDFSTKNAMKAQLENKRSVVVYCKDVREDASNLDDQTHRGAYFFLKGFNKVDSPIWQEVLLGTHSHTNIDELERLSNIDYSKIPAGGMLMKALPSGEIEFEEIPAGLPALPYEYQEKLKKLREIKASEPTHEELGLENNRLDGILVSRLLNSYEWLERDEYGNYKNITTSNCKELYYALRKSAAFLKLEYVPGSEGTPALFKLVQSDAKTKLAVDLTTENAIYKIYSPIEEDGKRYLQEKDTNSYFISLPIDSIIEGTSKHIIDSNTDSIFLFDGNRLFSSDECQLVDVDKRNKLVSFSLAKSAIELDDEEVHRLTVLVVYNGKEEESLQSDLLEYSQENVDFLSKIDEELLKLYITDQLYRKPHLQQLYLTTNEEGEIEWSNTLLPTQFFYNSEKVLTSDDMATLEDRKIKVTFKDVYFKVDEDFPILMVRDGFGYRATYRAVGNDLEYTIPVDATTIRTDDLGLGDSVRLLVIKNSAGSSLADEIADKYISKEDAVAILTHGKLDLGDYVKKSDLLSYAKTAHSHAAYALKGHNHDYKYANFHHTHPELAELITIIADGASQEEIEVYIASIEENERAGYDALVALLENSNIIFKDDSDNWHLSDYNLFLNNISVQILNEKLEQFDYLEANDRFVPGETHLIDVLAKLMDLFGIDTVTDAQVLLDNPITVRLKNGPIGGLEREKTYKKGTKLQEILRDILNPFIDVEEVRKILTPTDIQFTWYYLDTDSNELVEFDLTHAQGLVFIENPRHDIYFRMKAINEYGNECILSSIIDEKNNIQSVVLTPKKENGEEFAKLYGSDSIFHYGYIDFSLLSSFDKIINVFYKSTAENDMIMDNYGIKRTETLTDGQDLYIRCELKAELDIPDFYYGIIARDELETLRKGDLTPSYKFSDIHFRITSDDKIVVFLLEKSVEDKIDVIDKATRDNIKPYFTRYYDAENLLNNIDQNYALYTYDVLIPIESLDLQLVLRGGN